MQPVPAALVAASTPPGRHLPPTLSLLLDTTRFGLAFLVLLGHWCRTWFGTPLPATTALASAAVGAFFILSGFTIRLLTPRRENFEFGAYLAGRASRLWSVALLALLATAVCDSIAYAVAPEYYRQVCDQPSWSQSLVGLGLNALFASQIWGYDVAPLSNDPFWSLGYEFGFYLVYGVWMAEANPTRRVAYCLLACAALGPHIAAMFCIWLLGAAIFEVYTRMTQRVALALLGAGLVALLACVGYAAAHAGHLQVHGQWERLLDPWRPVIGSGFAAIGLEPQRVCAQLLTGAMLFAPFLLLVCALSVTFDGARVRVIGRLSRRARTLGEMTFPLYLLHYPLLVVYASLVPQVPRGMRETLAVLAGVCLIAYASIAPTTRFKRRLRTALQRKPAALAGTEA